MKTSADRAWLFTIPESASYSQLPGCAITPTGGIEMVEQNAAVRQSLFLLLSISPGERVMYPDYGCNLNRLFFLPNDETTAGLAIHYIRQAVNKWEQRVRILSIDAVSEPQASEQLTITMEYRIVATQQNESLKYQIDLSGRDT